MHRTRLLSERSRPKLKTSSRPSVQIGVQDSVAILQFDVRNGERETARAFEAQAASLSSNPLNILCVVIHLSGGVSTGLTASARSVHLIETAIRKLRTLNVPIVCSASGTIHGVAALILRAADYSMADESSCLDGQNAVQAQRMGLASAVNTPRHAEAFGRWLVQHPSIGLRMMLPLIRSNGQTGTSQAEGLPGLVREPRGADGADASAYCLCG